MRDEDLKATFIGCKRTFDAGEYKMYASIEASM